MKPVNYFPKMLDLKCLAGLWIHLWTAVISSSTKFTMMYWFSEFSLHRVVWVIFFVCIYFFYLLTFFIWIRFVIILISLYFIVFLKDLQNSIWIVCVENGLVLVVSTRNWRLYQNIESEFKYYQFKIYLNTYQYQHLSILTLLTFNNIHKRSSLKLKQYNVFLEL